MLSRDACAAERFQDIIRPPWYEIGSVKNAWVLYHCLIKVALPLEDFIVTYYKTAARITIILLNTYFLQSADFVEKLSLESSPASKTPSSYCPYEHQNLHHFTGFINNCDVDGTSTFSL